MFIKGYFIVTLAIAAVISDLLTGKIHNVIIAAGIGAGVYLMISGTGTRGYELLASNPELFIQRMLTMEEDLFTASVPLKDRILSFLIGGAIPLALGYPLFHFRMIGAGDVKLLSAIGCMAGGLRSLHIVLASILMSGIIAAAFLLCVTGIKSRGKVLLKYAKEVKATCSEIGLKGLFKDNPLSYRETSERMGNASLAEFHFSVPILMGTLLSLGGLL